MSKESIRSFISLIQEIENNDRTNRDRGTLFELLTKTFLKNEPMYQRLFDEVWMLNEVPTEYNIPKIDTGVDLVAKKSSTGELVAIQSKYYSDTTTIRKENIDSFLNEIGKNYYSEGLIVTTTDKWSHNADEALKNRNKTIMRISLSQLKESRIDWSKFSFSKPKEIELQSKKIPRQHQLPAIDAVIKGFESSSRGKLIMAPGTGKTFTSMAIAESLAEKKSDTYIVLYLVPSIQLLSQTLRSWNADTSYDMESIAVCSDRKVTKERIGTELEDIATVDIGFPATTNTDKLLQYQNTIDNRHRKPEFISIFSTYQSIDVIIEAQKAGFYQFDLIVCDEAHRTTGTTELNQNPSLFTKVHDNNSLQSDKRLYQTATPRIYGEEAKEKAAEKSILIADMNDSLTYGEEFYRIGFGDAIRKGILTDYKVMVLAVDEDVIARRFQEMFSKSDSGLQFDDVTKIIGCWNGLVKRDGHMNKTLGEPMKRAIAFTGTIKDSKNITEMFSSVVDEYLYKDNYDSNSHFKIDIKHADGTMNAIEKNEKIDWLKSDVPENTCRVLSNARFLTEGVDVPDLDAVMFLKPRKSKIDIAQAVGRVMRKSPGKDYGYIILPIGVPSGAEAHTILDNHEKYAVVWEILNALRSIDERFDATINKLALNKIKPKQLQVIGVGNPPEGLETEYGNEQLTGDEILFSENLTDLERAIYGKIVNKVGNVRYWEQWSEDVAKIAQQHITRINIMLENKQSIEYKEFKTFMKSIHQNINDSISESQAIEMLSQHLITKPVFEALFEKYSFVNNNPVSKAMESILQVLDTKGLLKEQKQLEGFYESVRVRAEGIDNLKAKQDIIIQLYDKFFKVGFKETTNRLGIVFTPVEVVDFIIQSVDDTLKKYFNKSLADEGVHVLDPFTGTGTFVTRLLQSGLLSKEVLMRKYTSEIHANEIVLLSYYIAAINIEETFHSLYDGDYLPFEGIVLTDTFETTESKDSFMDELFSENNIRLKKQSNKPIFAVIGNPPYSAGQGNENDNNKNVKYDLLDKRISETYVKEATSRSLRTYYDSYIKSFRWATDRLGDEGIISFVTNSSFIDKPVMNGIRKSFTKEFNYLYILNLKGAIRGRSGESAKKEGQNIFDIMTGVSISILIKDGSDNHKIYYQEVDDYLTRSEKKEALNSWKSVKNIDWIEITPDENGDWINQRDKNYQSFYPLYNEDSKALSIFLEKTSGIVTNRDAWVYNFSEKSVTENTKKMIANYNLERLRLVNKKDKYEFAEKNENFIKWTRSLKGKLETNTEINFSENTIVKSLYRPYTKKYLNYDKNIIESPRNYWKGYFEDINIGIIVSGIGSRKGFSALAIDSIPSMDIMEKGQVFLLKSNSEIGLFQYDNNYLISKSMCKEFGLSESELLYYIYAILHHKDYRKKYKNDLIKDFPRIPKIENSEKFVEIGKQLFYLHLSYEKCDLFEDINIDYKSDKVNYKVKKMKYKKRGEKSSIVFNDTITINDIPDKAFNYIINGRSAIDWIINQYQDTVDIKTGIIDNPNNHTTDDKYIFNLLLRVINVSVQTVELIDSLPKIILKE